MLSLNDREWKEFFISGNEGIFEIKATKSGIDKNKLNFSGESETPYITRSDAQNGINMFIPGIQQSKYSKDFGNCITIGLDTQTVFYQPHDFFTGQNIQVLNYDGMTKEAALFICSMLKVQMRKFNWGGNGATLGRLSRTKIMLPVNSEGIPDYEFMKAYAIQQGQPRQNDYIQYCKECISQLGSPVKICDTVEKEWYDFFVDDIFTIDSGKRLESYNMTAGIRPFIGATDSGNGITNYISNENESLDSNVLGVNYNGNGMVISFYHSYECLFSDDVKRFHLKNHPDNKYVLLFFKTLILQQKAKYNYGYKFNATRMKRQKIMLPTTEAGEPDYDYMEQYAKNMMIRKYQQYLDYYKKAKP